MDKRSREHLSDYQLGDDGSYEYRGAYWRWERPKGRPALLRSCWALVAGTGACLLAAGFVPVNGLGSAALVLLPYAVAAVAVVLVVFALLRLTREGERLRDLTYQRSVPTLAAKVSLGMVSAMASGIGGVINLVTGWGVVGACVPFAALMVVAGILLAQLLRKVRTISFVQE